MVIASQTGGTFACNCIGPQNGEPVCPCRMPAYRIQKSKDDLWERVMNPHHEENRKRTDRAETPAEKAKRIGVPLIPARPILAPVDLNPIVSVCGACGTELRRVMGFVCSRTDCPCFPQVTA